MGFRQYMFLMAFASVAAWLGFVISVFSIDPARTGLLGIMMFYVTLAVALVGTIAIIGAGVRVWRHKNELASRIVVRALRQSFLLTTLVMGSLLMLSHDLFHPFPAAMFILFLSLVEFVFLSSKRELPQESES